MADPSPSGDVFDLAKVRELIALMKEHDLSEVDLKQAEQQIRLKRGGPAAAAVYAPAPSPAPAAAQPPAADGPHIKIVRSPMVGTFYSRPSPDAKNFVSVGDHVGPETVVCIIEAMKVFNEIQSELSGQIVAVLVQNEEPVEFGKPLFKVDTGK